MHLDAPHDADRDGNTGGSRVISLSIRSQDWGLHHCVGGSDRACSSQSLHPQPPVDGAFPGCPGHIHTVPTRPVFPHAHLRIRHGDSGTLRGFAVDIQKIQQAGGAKRPSGKAVITQPKPVEVTGGRNVRKEW